MNHLERLLAEYYEWQGHFVRSNVHVGRRPQGGWEMELDVVIFDPHTQKVLHIEPSLDADSWATREQRFCKEVRIGAQIY